MPSPEMSLWAAVMGRSIEDLSRKKERKSARYWFENEKDDGIGSFKWICEIFSLNPDMVRANILKTYLGKDHHGICKI